MKVKNTSNHKGGNVLDLTVKNLSESTFFSCLYEARDASFFLVPPKLQVLSRSSQEARPSRWKAKDYPTP